ncbi:MAG: DUF3656 domain-containing protein [Bradymonadia bacterium]
MADRPLRLELLAPAGNQEALDAALAAGADAVYFGLDEGFNARARAAGFTREGLPETMAQIHRAGARGYLTFNTLVFESELPHVEAALRDVAFAGVDAIIVQDPAVALIARAVCPDLEIHASTQMTVSSPEAARFAETLGVSRVVVPRELSIDQIAKFKANTSLELEVFIHGALCMAWSGQCLTSEAWGGRSANRGQCAQSCRMPYDLEVDGEMRDLGDVRYLLSPRDLAGFRAVPALAEIGVHSLKIEGRYKGPAYVVTTVQAYRRWAKQIAEEGESALDPEGEAVSQLKSDLTEMGVVYSRGFGDGFFGGSDHQTLVGGRFPKNRGVRLGQVIGMQGNQVRVRPWSPDAGDLPRTGGLALADGPGAPQGVLESALAPLGGDPESATGAPRALPEVRPGMGVVFDAGNPESPNEAGGPIFSVNQVKKGKWTDWLLGFGRPGPDLRRVEIGQQVWLNSDPAVHKRVSSLVARGPEGRIPMSMRVWGQAGAPLKVLATAMGHSVDVRTDFDLAPSTGAGLTEQLMRDKLGALGGTPFTLGDLDLSGLGEGLHVPVSALKALRRDLVFQLDVLVAAGPDLELEKSPALPRLHTAIAERWAEVPEVEDPAPTLIPLCRTDAQLDALIALLDEGGPREVELDWMEFIGLRKAVERARTAGLKVHIASVRVQKPGEAGYDRRIETLAPDGVLVRHWGGLMHFSTLPADQRPEIHGDFSLNVTNAITAAHVLSLGLDSFTVAHDLDAEQLFGLFDRMKALGIPRHRATVTVHHHIPTFHTEHCVYAHLLSNGRDFRTCGRPCEAHQVGLKDHTGKVHPVLVDVECRNTVFNAQAQSAASLVPRMLEAGVRRFRVECVREDAATTRTFISAWSDLLAGRIDPSTLNRRVGVHEQFGVTAGTMRVLS